MIVEASYRFGPAQSGRVSRRSGRDVQMSRIGASRTNSPRFSTRSKRVRSAQWMSSKTAISGRSRATLSKSLRIDQKVSSGLP
jgi:hypothetical protein